MDIISIVFIAFALSMDAFAVSLSSGTALKQPTIQNAAIIGLYFGGFQFLMPLIGWFLGSKFHNFILMLLALV